MLFQHPLDVVDQNPNAAVFCEHRRWDGVKYHAAEDYWRPAGSEVYAMADGEVSFSGMMGGYGWLVIVDHPEMNLYSLYGHLSPSRWRTNPGPVDKGDLIGYLGDEWENGGSRDRPLVPHLHVGVRVGQRTDYPGKGEWRWMAGWTRPCPADLGWLQPSAVIAGQHIPHEALDGRVGGFVEKWWVEILLTGAILAGAVWWTVVAIRTRKPLLIIPVAAGLLIAGWYLTKRGLILTAPLFAAAIVLLIASIVMFVRRLFLDKPDRLA